VQSLKRLVLTPDLLDSPHGLHHKYLHKKFEEARILQRFRRSAWGQKLLARQRKEKESDFDRFVAMKKHRASYARPSKVAPKKAEGAKKAKKSKKPKAKVPAKGKKETPKVAAPKKETPKAAPAKKGEKKEKK
jgi:hypothetical protein